MKKKASETQQGPFQNELTIIEPMKVRLSRKGNTVKVVGMNSSTW